MRIAGWALILFVVVGSLAAEDTMSMFKNGKYDELLKKYEVTLSHHPEMEEAHFGKGAVLYKKGEIEEALREFEKAITIKDPKKKSAVYYNIGNALFRANRLEESLKFFRRAIELNPYDYDAKYNYEFVKRLLKNSSKQDQKNKDSDNKQQDKKKENEKKQQSEEQKKREKSESKKQQQQQQQSSQSQENAQKRNKKVKDQYKTVLDALNENEKKMLKEKLRFKSKGIVRDRDW